MNEGYLKAHSTITMDDKIEVIDRCPYCYGVFPIAVHLQHCLTKAMFKDYFLKTVEEIQNSFLKPVQKE